MTQLIAALCTWAWDDSTEHLDVARPELVRIARSRGWRPVEYSDVVPTSNEALRPRRDALMADVRAGRVAAVVVDVTSSVAESPRGLAALMNEFADRDVTFVCLEERLDTSNPDGQLVAGVLGELLPPTSTSPRPRGSGRGR